MKTNEDELKDLIADIERSSPQHIQKNPSNETFALREDLHLVSDLSGNIGALFIRAILSRLNVNEHHLVKWHLENKYRQYQILNYYAPGAMPETIGLYELFNRDNGIQQVKSLCENGFFIKAALGDGSGRAKSFDKTNELDEIIKSYKEEHEAQEKWILQEKLDLISEFRIHTFGRDLLYGLTFKIEGHDTSNSIDAEEFVEAVLATLPDTILLGTLIGWDIGITSNNRYYVIEANITGIHSVFNPGFQTSGYFGDGQYGPIMCAWINNYFRNKYKISIDDVETGLRSTDPFYSDFLFYVSIFKNEHFEILQNKRKGITTAAILYVGNHINMLLFGLVDYFLIQKFADQYYLIIDEKYEQPFQKLFSENKFLKVLVDHTLFTSEEYELIKQQPQINQKESCCSRIITSIQEETYFIV